jgi:hypothetical protein
VSRTAEPLDAFVQALLERWHASAQTPQEMRAVAALRAVVAAHADTNDGDCATCVIGGWGWPVMGACSAVAYPCPTVRHVAAIWAEHPDYDPAWAPEDTPSTIRRPALEALARAEMLGPGDLLTVRTVAGLDPDIVEGLCWGLREAIPSGIPVVVFNGDTVHAINVTPAPEGARDEH